MIVTARITLQEAVQLKSPWLWPQFVRQRLEAQGIKLKPSQSMFNFHEAPEPMPPYQALYDREHGVMIVRQQQGEH